MSCNIKESPLVRSVLLVVCMHSFLLCLSGSPSVSSAQSLVQSHSIPFSLPSGTLPWPPSLPLRVVSEQFHTECSECSGRGTPPSLSLKLTLELATAPFPRSSPLLGFRCGNRYGWERRTGSKRSLEREKEGGEPEGGWAERRENEEGHRSLPLSTSLWRSPGVLSDEAFLGSTGDI